MGLDMYLYAETFVSGYDHSKDKNFSEILGLLGLKEETVCKHLTVKVNIAYWRKANSIHNWFVSNCAKGEDDCRPVLVTREKLEELIKTCQSAISAYNRGDKKEAQNLLSPTEGFFFGSTEINDWYLQDLLNTVAQIKKILNNSKLKTFDFYYQASW